MNAAKPKHVMTHSVCCKTPLLTMTGLCTHHGPRKFQLFVLFKNTDIIALKTPKVSLKVREH